MLAYLGRMLSARRRALRVAYLSKAETEPAWRDGWLISIDAHGASFAAREAGGEVECLPWGSIGSIRVEETTDAGDAGDSGGEARPAFFQASAGRAP